MGMTPNNKESIEFTMIVMAGFANEQSVFATHHSRVIAG